MDIFLESSVIRSFHLGLLMGHDTFSRLRLVNLHWDNLWNIGYKTGKLFEGSGVAASISKTKILKKKVSCPISRHLKARLEQGYRIGLHWTVFQESCHNFWVSKMQLICLQVIADTVQVWKSIWNMFLH